MTEYKHTKDMGEISGFGGGYEEMCQTMLDAGVKWIVQCYDVKLEASENPNIFGVFTADNFDTKELEFAVLEACNNDCTGAMHHAVMSRLMYIGKHGWDKYCEDVREVIAKRESNMKALIKD